MKKYPPIVVSIVAMILFSASAVTAITSEGMTANQPQAEEPVFVQAPEPAKAEEVQITTEPQATYASAIHSRDWDGEDSERLTKLAMAEAEGESVDGKALVMLVALNRVWSDQFPDTIEEVIFQWCGNVCQFYPVSEGGRYWTTEPNEECWEALELVMSGWDESQGALYFENTGRDGWHSQNLEFLFQAGGHKFYR